LPRANRKQDALTSKPVSSAVVTWPVAS